MAEIYLNSSDTNNTPLISTRLYDGGLPFNSDEEVTVQFTRHWEPEMGNTTLPTITVDAEKTEIDDGAYQVRVPSGLFSANYAYSATATWLYDGKQKTTKVNVIKPYVDLYEAADDLGLGIDPNDPTHKTYNDLRLAEKYARMQIESYTGQKFYLYKDTFSVMGSDSDMLPLSDKIKDIFTLKAKDEILIDNLNDINNVGYLIEPTVSGYGIKINQEVLLDNITYIANGMVPPSIHDIMPNIFRKDVRYDVWGRFGWTDIPEDVTEAAKELMKMYFAKDRHWRDRYVKTISTTDWDFEYDSNAFSGTGSAYADKLLSDYVITEMVLI